MEILFQNGHRLGKPRAEGMCMAEESRTKKSFRNIGVGVFGLLLYIVSQFITKSVFIDTLGIEYNGVNGLYANILSVLNLSDLGFATAVAYALYKPLKEGDGETIAAIMRFFRNVYRIVAAVVLCLGLLCIPFLQYLIAEKLADLPFTLNQLRLFFGMFLLNTVCSYLLAYKRTLITADQNSYIVSAVDYSSNILLNVLQIILLLVTKNYMAFLVIMVARTIVSNIILHVIAGKKYPVLGEHASARITRENRTLIIKNVEALFLHRLGDVLMYSTTSILISALVGLTEAGKYSNYIMVVNNIYAVIGIIFSGITASVGDLSISEDEDKQYEVYRRAAYVAEFLSVFVFACYMGLFNDFITLWVKAENCFPTAVVAVISFNAMVRILRRATLTYKDAKGLFRADWYKPVAEAAAGIGLAVGLSFCWGTFGILFGYTAATVLFAIPVENVVLFKSFHRSALLQILRMAGTMLFGCALAALTYYICTFIPGGENWGWFVLEAAFCVVFAALVLLLVTYRMKEAAYYRGVAGGMAAKLRAKFGKRKRGGEDDTKEDGGNT